MQENVKGTRWTSVRRLIVCSAAVLSLGAGAASAQPDLVINVNDSEVRAGNCTTDQPLAAGRIAIKNIGASRATVKLVDRVTRSMVAVYVPENIDMIARVSRREQLDPFDQEGIEFEIGRGVEKRGRFFGTPPSQVSTAIQTRTERDRVRAIQTALTNLGYDTKGVDGVYGGNTRTAASAYQRSQNEKVTGELTSRQIDRLLDRTGEQVVGSSGARGIMDIKLYAVVDPYNLVNESNEANNIVQFTIRVDCSK